MSGVRAAGACVLLVTFRVTSQHNPRMLEVQYKYFITYIVGIDTATHYVQLRWTAVSRLRQATDQIRPQLRLYFCEVTRYDQQGKEGE